MSGTSRPMTARRVSASWLQLCGSHAHENPSAAASAPRWTITSIAACSTLGKKMPIRTGPSLRPGEDPCPREQVPCAPMDTIPDALRRAVATWGDRDFIVTPDRRMTYRDAEEHSRRLAKRMVAAGIGKGTRVGVFLTYGQEWVGTWLAARRVGGLV